jgi:hypothetical protein
LRRLSPIALLVLCAPVPAAVELPSIVPQVSSVFPHSVRRGSEASVELRGMYLSGATEFQSPDGALTAVIDSTSFRSIRARIKAATDAEPGRHDLRLVTPRGVWFGVFWVGDELDEQTEVEPNDSLKQAQPVSLPAIVHGRADGADGDYFRLHAEAGQTLVFDVMATRLGSALDPVLTLLDEGGREIAYNDDAYIFKDARLAHTFSRTGEYYLVVSASFERSARDAEYRLQITQGPFAAKPVPLGARRGTTAEITIRGWNLDRAERVWLDRPGVPAQVVSRAPGELKVRIALPSHSRIGAHQLHVSGGGPPVRFEIGDLPELAAAAKAVAAPVVVNGEIPGADLRIHRYQDIAVDVRGGERLEFAVEAWNLGQLMDPVITLFDPAGQLLLQEDDPAPNSFIHHPATHDPRMVYVFPVAGRYRVRIHDAAYEAGGSYRLTIRPVQPDVELDVRAPQFTALTGRTTRLLAVVKRTGGVHRVEAFRKPDSEIEHFRLVEVDGWNKPVPVSVAGLPPGVTAESVTAEPKNTVFKGNDGEELFVDGTLVEIPITIRADAQPGVYPIEVHGAGRKATVRYGAPRALRHLPTPDQMLLLNIVQAPPILWNTPAEISLSRGEQGSLKVGLVRLDGEYPVSVSAKQIAGGWTLAAAHASAAAEEVEVPVTAGSGAPAEPAEVVLLATFDRGGRKETVESPPIQLRVKP